MRNSERLGPVGIVFNKPEVAKMFQQSLTERNIETAVFPNTTALEASLRLNRFPKVIILSKNATIQENVAEIPRILIGNGEGDDAKFELDNGASRYIKISDGKPKDIAETAAAMAKGIIERSRILSPITVGNVCINPSGRLLTIEGQTKKLSPKQFDLLSFLMDNADNVLSHDEIHAFIQRRYKGHNGVNIRMTLREIRLSLGNYAEHVVSVRKKGYFFASNPKQTKLSRFANSV